MVSGITRRRVLPLALATKNRLRQKSREPRFRPARASFLFRLFSKQALDLDRH